MRVLLVGVIRLDSWAALSMVSDAWSAICADWWSVGLIVGVDCGLCCVFCSLPQCLAFVTFSVQHMRSPCNT